MNTSLAGSVWQVESIDAGGIVDSSMVTLDFTEAGRVAGYGSCNRYFGSATFEGHALSVGPLASTLKACPEALMNQERSFFQAMEAAARFEIERDQWLVLTDEEGRERIRAIRVDSDPTLQRPGQ